MKQKIIPRDYLRTPTEELLRGGRLIAKPKSEDEWHIPQGLLLKKRYSIDEVRRARQEVGHDVIGGPLTFHLSELEGRLPLAMSYEKIDSAGQTVSDPKILGLWDEEKRQVVPVEGRDLTAELYGLFASRGVDLHLRGAPSREREGFGTPEA